jgi:hypothetical protein
MTYRPDDFDATITCEEFYGEEPPSHEELIELETQTNAPTWEDDIDVPLFESDGGLTGDAQQMLGDWDADGRFV